MEYGKHKEGWPAVVLLHGMFGNAENWRPCAERLSPQWRVLVPELPVLDLPPSETSVEGLGEHVSHLLDRGGIDRAVIAGNSLGGHVALQLALRYPWRVTALILTGSSGLFERGFAGSVSRRPTRDWLRAKVRDVFYDEAHVTEALLDEVSKTIFNPGMLLQILRVAKSAKHGNLRNELHRIACPVLLAWGEDDKITTPSVAHEFEEILPDTELKFIPRCGHAPMVERPHEFINIVEQFLDRIFGHFHGHSTLLSPETNAQPAATPTRVSGAGERLLDL